MPTGFPGSRRPPRAGHPVPQALKTSPALPLYVRREGGGGRPPRQSTTQKDDTTDLQAISGAGGKSSPEAEVQERSPVVHAAEMIEPERGNVGLSAAGRSGPAWAGPGRALRSTPSGIPRSRPGSGFDPDHLHDILYQLPAVNDDGAGDRTTTSAIDAKPGLHGGRAVCNAVLIQTDMLTTAVSTCSWFTPTTAAGITLVTKADGTSSKLGFTAADVAPIMSGNPRRGRDPAAVAPAGSAHRRVC
jgi:hypothetical protein